MNDAAAPRATVARDGTTLTFAGTLERAAIAALWPQALALLPGVARFDLSGVDRVDSAGLALLAELDARLGAAAEVHGEPAGLRGLRAAYRLDAGLRSGG